MLYILVDSLSIPSLPVFCVTYSEPGSGGSWDSIILLLSAFFEVSHRKNVDGSW